MSIKIPSPDGNRWNGPFLASILALSVATCWVVLSIPSLISAATSVTPDDQSEKILDELVADHNSAVAVNIDRFLGRSPFFVPKRPPNRPRPRTPRPEPEKKTDTTPVDTGPPPAPLKYQGPQPTSIFGNRVYFRAKNEWVQVDQKSGDGVTVLDIHDFSNVKLAHRGGEYTVSTWEDQESNIFENAFDGTSIDSLKFDSSGRNTTQGQPAPRSPAQPTSPGNSRSDFNEANPIPAPISDSDLKSMNRSDLGRAAQKTMAAMRRSDLSEGDRERLDKDLERIKERLQNPSR